MFPIPVGRSTTRFTSSAIRTDVERPSTTRLRHLRTVHAQLAAEAVDFHHGLEPFELVLDHYAASAQAAVDSLAQCCGGADLNDLEQHVVARIGHLVADLDQKLRPHLHPSQSASPVVGFGRPGSS